MAQAFIPALDANIPLSATTTTSSASLKNGNAPMQVRIYNAGTATAFLNFGTSAVTATTSGFPVPSGAIEVITIPGNATTTYAAAITASGTASVYITPGAGI